MGMYTELVFKARVSKKNTPPLAMAVLAYMFGGAEHPGHLPVHPFFNHPHWDMIGMCSSFYHHPNALSDFYDKATSDVYIFSRSDIKNYSGEIEAFLDWVMPFVDEVPGMCIGWTWYEEASAPTLIFKTTVHDEE